MPPSRSGASTAGIEIGGPNSAEAKGALASPEYAEANDLEWSDGQTLTRRPSARSYNLFTPLQLANYIATLVGNGEHYAAHLLKNVKTYNNSAVVYAYDKDPVNVVEMQDSTVEAIKTGMHDLTTGSLSTYFSKCVVSAGAKTGTAETRRHRCQQRYHSCALPPMTIPRSPWRWSSRRAAPVRLWRRRRWISSMLISAGRRSAPPSSAKILC